MNMQHSHPISLRKILAIEVVGRSKLQNLQILRNTIYSLTYITVKNAKQTIQAAFRMRQIRIWDVGLRVDSFLLRTTRAYCYIYKICMLIYDFRRRNKRGREHLRLRRFSFRASERFASIVLRYLISVATCKPDILCFLNNCTCNNT